MYQKHWNLAALPFLDADDPRFYVETPAAAEAAARMDYGARARRGAVCLDGPAGVGKSLAARRFAAAAAREGFATAVVSQPMLAHWDLLREAARQFEKRDGILSGDPVETLAALRRAAREGPGAILVLDGADRLADPAAWEGVRWLLEGELDPAGGVGVVLVGEAASAAARARLGGRLTVSCRIEPLSPPEAAAYVQKRLAAAGAAGEVFAPEALAALAAAAAGVPRHLNRLADLAMLVAYGRGAARVDEGMVAEAASDWAGREPEAA